MPMDDRVGPLLHAALAVSALGPEGQALTFLFIPTQGNGGGFGAASAALGPVPPSTGRVAPNWGDRPGGRWPWGSAP